MSLWTAMALLAGSVHGVVVHMTALRVFQSIDRNSLLKASEICNGNFTKAAVEVWFSSYSSSASARAVPDDGDQYTGLYCRYIRPEIVRIVLNPCGDSIEGSKGHKSLNITIPETDLTLLNHFLEDPKLLHFKVLTHSCVCIFPITHNCPCFETLHLLANCSRRQLPGRLP